VLFRKERLVIKNLNFRYRHLTSDIKSRNQIFFSKTWCCLRQGRNLLQSTAKVHHAQLY